MQPEVLWLGLGECCLEAPGEKQSSLFFLAGTALRQASQGAEEELGHAGVPHSQKEFQSLPPAQETRGKGRRQRGPGQGLGAERGSPQFSHVPCVNLREERVKPPSSPGFSWEDEQSAFLIVCTKGTDCVSL